MKKSKMYSKIRKNCQNRDNSDKCEYRHARRDRQITPLFNSVGVLSLVLLLLCKIIAALPLVGPDGSALLANQSNTTTNSTTPKPPQNDEYIDVSVHISS